MTFEPYQQIVFRWYGQPRKAQIERVEPDRLFVRMLGPGMNSRKWVKIEDVIEPAQEPGPAG